MSSFTKSEINYLLLFFYKTYNSWYLLIFQWKQLCRRCNILYPLIETQMIWIPPSLSAFGLLEKKIGKKCDALNCISLGTYEYNINAGYWFTDISSRGFSSQYQFFLAYSYKIIARLVRVKLITNLFVKFHIFFTYVLLLFICENASLYDFWQQQNEK